MGVYNVGEGGLGQTYGPTAQLIAAYVVLRRPIAIGVAPNCISKRLGNRTPGGRDRALFTPDSQPIAVQLPAGRYSRNSWGTLDLRGGIRVRCRARGGKLWITGDGQVDKVLPSWQRPASPGAPGAAWNRKRAAADRGATDKALAGLLFQGGLRRSEAAALRWADVQDAVDGRGIVVCVRRASATGGCAAGTRAST